MAGEAQAQVERFTDQQILEEFDKLKNVGVIDYVIPTEPIGERWAIGVEGQVANLSPDEAFAFLLGASAVAKTMARRAGLEL